MSTASGLGTKRPVRLPLKIGPSSNVLACFPKSSKKNKGEIYSIKKKMDTSSAKETRPKITFPAQA